MNLWRSRRYIWWKDIWRRVVAQKVNRKDWQLFDEFLINALEDFHFVKQQQQKPEGDALGEWCALFLSVIPSSFNDIVVVGRIYWCAPWMNWHWWSLCLSCMIFLRHEFSAPPVPSWKMNLKTQIFRGTRGSKDERRLCLSDHSHANSIWPGQKKKLTLGLYYRKSSHRHCYTNKSKL